MTQRLLTMPILFWMLFKSALVFAGDFILYGVSPNSTATVSKTVVSIAEQRYNNLIRQSMDFTCGAAALATILRYGYDMNVTEESVLDGLFTVTTPEKALKSGFSLLDIKSYVEKIGFKGLGYHVDVKMLNFLKIPVIVLVNLDGYSHFVVLKKVENGRAYIADPMLGHQVVPLTRFAQTWNNVLLAVVRSDFDKNTPLFRTRKTLPVKRLFEIAAPIQPIRANLDFGLISRGYLK